MEYLGHTIVDKGSYWKITKGSPGTGAGASAYKPSFSAPTLEEAKAAVDRGEGAHGPIPYNHSVVEPGDEIV